jgi:peptide/nickel transport system substrate-binding protein
MSTSIRRRVRRLLALPIALLTTSALVTACGSSNDSASSSGAGSSVINWAYTSGFPSWDPVVVGATSATQVLSTIYEPLFTLNAQNQVKPALATDWKYNADGTAITITLRPGLSFQDGSPLNAEAVAYNVQRLQSQRNSALKALWQDVKSATVIDDTHVQLNLKQTDYQIPYILANRSSLLASEKAAKADPAAPSRHQAWVDRARRRTGPGSVLAARWSSWDGC